MDFCRTVSRSFGIPVETKETSENTEENPDDPKPAAEEDIQRE